jgi:GGDEF domain-containing protein
MTLTYERGFDYALLWKILLAIGIVGVFAAYRHISITRYNRALPVTWFIDKADQQLYRAKEGGRDRYKLESL